MNIPIETIVAILLAEFALSEELPFVDISGALGGLAAFLALSYLFAVMASQRTRGLIRAARLHPYKIVARHRLHMFLHKVALLSMYWMLLFQFGWGRAVQDAFGPGGMSVLDDLVVMAPFVAAKCVAWLGFHATDMLLGRRIWSSWEYVWFKLRYTVLILLIPWCLLKLFEEASDYFTRLVSWDYAGYAAMGTVIVAAVVGFPVFLKWLFGAKPMPPSELRWRLERLCGRVKLKIRDILIWPMGGSRILNAAVMGVVPRVRYILFSDALLDVLTYEECEAVLCHEIGHIKSSHTPLYLLFTAGFVLCAMTVMGFFPPELQESYLFAAPILIALTCVYWRFIFGFISRRFERQADLYAAELMGDPVALVLALEKISLMSGDARELPQWRHYSIAERVRHLLDVGFEPRRLQAYHASVKRSVRLGLACVAGLVVWTAYGAMTEPRGAAVDVERMRAVVRQNPDNDVGWLNLARAWVSAGDLGEASRAYRQVITLSPGTTVAAEAEEELLGLSIEEWRTRLALGRAFEGAGWLNRAEDDYRRSLNLKATIEGNVALASLLLEREAKSEEAVELARTAVEQGGGPKALGVLAEALFRAGKKEEAISCVKEALARVMGARGLEENLLEHLRRYEESPP